jgi:acetolactate decarboxylase
MLNKLWQIMPSMVFKTGLYDGIMSIGEAREHGSFGVGQFASLDGELTVVDGCFYRAKSDGSVALADDGDQLCFAELCFYKPSAQWEAPAGLTDQLFDAFLSSRLRFRNSFCGFGLRGLFNQIVPTSPPLLNKPYPPFSSVGALRKSFPVQNVRGTIVGFYSPAFAADTGIPGYHFHFISDDGKSSGHVTSFTLSEGTLDASRIDECTLRLPRSAEYDACNLQ